MNRTVLGAFASLLLVAAGLFWWQGRAALDVGDPAAVVIDHGVDIGGLQGFHQGVGPGRGLGVEVQGDEARGGQVVDQRVIEKDLPSRVSAAVLSCGACGLLI